MNSHHILTLLTVGLSFLLSTVFSALGDDSSDMTFVNEAVATLSVSVIGQVTVEQSDLSFREPDLTRTVIYLDAHPNLVYDEAQLPRPSIAQRNKAFVPDFLVVSVGTWVEFPNWDKFSHNVFSQSAAAPPFDLDRYPYGQSKSYQFVKQGIVQIFCNIHPHMRATVFSTPNPHFTQANTTGDFTLTEVPPGEYELVIWHQQFGETRKTIVVSTDQSLVLEAITLQSSSNRDASDHGRSHSSHYGGVERGLGVKRKKLNLPVIEESHPAAESPPTTQNSEQDQDVRSADATEPNNSSTVE